MSKLVHKKPLLIVDGYGFIFRAYHVQPPLTSPAGNPVGAIYGFTSMLIKLINDFKPEYAVIVLDHGSKNFRHDLYQQYKANRPPAPEDLKFQLGMVQKAAEALNFQCISKQGYEADDIIATFAQQATKQEIEAVIISADKDLMQLTNSYIKMYDPAKNKYIEEADIIAKFGVGADKVREVQALMGDKSDNIPGISGIGPKTAAQLINKFGNLENILNATEQLSPRHQKLFEDYAQDARISWQLVGLDHNVEVEFDVNKLKWQAPSVDHVSDFLQTNGFRSLYKRVENIFNITLPEQVKKTSSSMQDMKISMYEVKDVRELELFISKVKIDGRFALHHGVDSNNDYLLAACGTDIYKIKLNDNHEISDDLFSRASSNSQQVLILEKIYQLLQDPALKKITYDSKKILKLVSCKVQAIDDIMLMDYALNAGKSSSTLPDLIQDEDIDPDKQLLYFFECYDKIYAELVQQKILHLYNSIDLPISHILNKMENAGVLIDVSYLNELALILAQKINILEKNIYQHAGREFNIASPKQLGVVLFEELNLPFGKVKGKSQSYSTNVDILEKLKQDGHLIASELLEYRHLTKLQNTYIEALPKLVDRKTNRLHTTFLQCSTSTSRLSSINPNVQNIPIRTNEGSKIRAAFIAREGYQLISADYSQIELRILSHVADLHTLKQAFINGRDIHAHTASQIFGLPIEEITSEIRRKAKAINFGIIYGISAFGLAKQLDITNKEAADYMALYFKEYPGIQQYMDDTIKFAEKHGYVTNLLGRNCHLPSINDKNHLLRSFAKRAAINAPMQSLASDIVKIAMVKLERYFEKQEYKVEMIMQIHDELIFEASDSDVDEIMPIIKTIMQEQVAGIDLDVQIKAGKNWHIMK